MEELKITCGNLKCNIEMPLSQATFTIPLDVEWKRTDGTFCSVACSLYANRYQASPARMTGKADQREAWMRSYYKGWLTRDEKK